MNRHPMPMQPEMGAVLHFDGGSRKNPGPASWAFTLDRDGERLAARDGYLESSTNNRAEYTALTKGLEAAIEHSVTDLVVYGDSMVVICQSSGRWQVKAAELKPFHSKVLRLVNRIGNVAFHHIPRAQNVEADEMTARVFEERGFPKRLSDGRRKPIHIG